MLRKNSDAHPKKSAQDGSRTIPILLFIGLVCGAGVFFGLRDSADNSKSESPGSDLLVNPSLESKNASASAQTGVSERSLIRPPTNRHANLEQSASARDASEDLQQAAETEMAPAQAKEAANMFRRGQNNVFFNEEAFILSFSSQNGNHATKAIRDELRNTEGLVALPENVNFMRDTPSEVLDRMSMIDMLGRLAKDDPAALDALVDIINEPINNELPPQAIKVLVGEKYDAFVELARHDWTKASSTFSSLENAVLKDAMRPALVGGLIDSGTPREDALRMVESI